MLDLVLNLNILFFLCNLWLFLFSYSSIFFLLRFIFKFVFFVVKSSLHAHNIRRQGLDFEGIHGNAGGYNIPQNLLKPPLIPPAVNRLQKEKYIQVGDVLFEIKQKKNQLHLLI